jgi:hypothetical protein
MPILLKALFWHRWRCWRRPSSLLDGAADADCSFLLPAALSCNREAARLFCVVISNKIQRP